jgi:hypothetical protein
VTKSFAPAYSFVMRGLLAEDSLDAAGRKKNSNYENELEQIADLVGLDALDDEKIAAAQLMAVVYTAVAAFENSVRDLVSSTLLEQKGENWWADATSAKIRKAAEDRREEEEKVKWHTPRGSDPIQYTMLPNLLSIIRQNFDDFEPYVFDIDWVASVFDIIERSRNVIMHSGNLSRRDIARLGSTLRDWNTQVAT